MRGVTIHKKGTKSESYVAEMRINGERYRKSFSTKKYNPDNAFNLAIQYRAFLEQIEKTTNKSFLQKDSIEKLFMLKDICDFYNYTLEITDKIYYYAFSKDDKEYNFEATSVKEALTQWLETLEETDECNHNEGVLPLWSAERHLISNL